MAEEDKFEYPGLDRREHIRRSYKERRSGKDRRHEDIDEYTGEDRRREAEERKQKALEFLGRRTGFDRRSYERRKNTCITCGNPFEAERQGSNVCPNCKRRALAPPPPAMPRR